MEMVGVGVVGAWALVQQRPAFGALWSARTVSLAGDSLAHIALVLYVANRLGGGPAVAALLIVSDFAPTFLAPFLGSLGDRLDRRRLMIAVEALQAGVVALIAFWMPGLPGLLLLVAVNAHLARAFDPASSSAVPQLVAEKDLAVANSAIGFGTYGLAILGPVGAALLLPLIGLRGVLIVDAGSFVISALLLCRLPALSPNAVHAAESGGLWRETWIGFRYVWRNRVVRITVIGFALLVACTALDDVALVFLARHSLHASSSEASLLYAGADAGLLLGFLVLTRLRRIAAPLLFVGGMAVSSLGNMLTGLSWLIILAILSQIVRGLGIAGQDTGGNTLLQRHVPTDLQSRVFANYYNAIGLAAGLSYLAGGVALVSASPRAVLAGAGAAGILVTVGVAIALRRCANTA